MTCPHCGSSLAENRECACGTESQLTTSAIVDDTEWRGELRERLHHYREKRAKRVAELLASKASQRAEGEGKEPSAVAANVRRRFEQGAAPRKIIPFRRFRPVRPEPLAPDPQRAATGGAPGEASVGQPPPTEPVRLRLPEDGELATPVLPRARATKPVPGAPGPSVTTRVDPLPTMPESRTGMGAPAAPAPGDSSIALSLALSAQREQPLAEPVKPRHERLQLEALEMSGVMRIEIPLRLADDEERLQLPVATVGLRAFAGALDLAFVCLATLLFGGTVTALLGWMNFTRASLLRIAPAVAGVPALLAAIYVLASFHLGEATPGMMQAGLEVCGFDGARANRGALRRRAWASLLSLGALGMGYWWVLFDDEQLTWHDHISRTYVSERTGVVTGTIVRR